MKDYAENSHPTSSTCDTERSRIFQVDQHVLWLVYVKAWEDQKLF